MGKVIAFRAREKRARRDLVPQSGEAEILFFLGVRYMRMEDSAMAATELTPDRDAGPSGRKKRKSRARA